MPGIDGDNTGTNKGYFKNPYNSITLGAYVTSPDKSNTWSNGHEIGGYLGGGLALSDRVTLNGGIELGYVKATLDGDYDPGTKKNNIVFGMGLGGKVALNKNIAVTTSGEYKLQGYELMAYKSYMNDEYYIEDSPGFGHWTLPNEYASHSGNYYQFQNEMEMYNQAVYEYNKYADKHNEPLFAGKLSVSLGLEATNDKNTITGGIKGIYTHTSGYGYEKAENDKFSVEGYGSVNVGKGISINASVNPIDKVVKAGVNINLYY